MDTDARLRALFYTVLQPPDLVLAAPDETTLVQQFLQHILGQGVFHAAAVWHQRRPMRQEGTPQPESVVLVGTVMRAGQRWGTLRIWMNAAASGDSAVRDLVRWAGAVLGQSFDLWDTRHHLEEEAVRQRYRASHDDLTGLENRTAFLAALPAMLTQAHVDHTLLVVGMLDLDDFKPVNDTHGHGAGDQLLRDWSHRLLTWMHGPHRVARIGGDEFLFVLGGFTQFAAVETFLQDCLTDLTEPVVLPDGESVCVHASVGLTVAPEDGSDPDGLIRHADWALYRSKETKAHRDRVWTWYQPPAAPSRFHAAIPQHLRVHYQPIVDGQTGTVQSLEALVRLQDGAQLLSPIQFLPQLSPQELETLTFGVLDHVLRDIQQLDVWGHTPQPLSVALNLEPSMLSPACIDHIGEQVRQARVQPDRITLELLETSDFLSRDLAKSQLQILKARQFQLALDDVGSAYSSLLRIKELPIDTFKLDQAFVRHIPDDPDDLLFVISIQTLARGFQAHFVAEGVETLEILDALQVLGVDRIQGYVFAKPMPLTELLHWLQAFTPQPAGTQPRSLLGAYAAHLAYQFLDRVLPRATGSHGRAEACPLTHYLRDRGFMQTDLAREHDHYHAHWESVTRDAQASAPMKGALLAGMQELALAAGMHTNAVAHAKP